LHIVKVLNKLLTFGARIFVPSIDLCNLTNLSTHGSLVTSLIESANTPIKSTH